MRKLIKMRAGQYSQSMGRETVCLSPLPLPTGAAGISKTLFLQTNQTYLDFGAKDAWGFEYVIRVYTGVFVLLFMTIFILPVIFLPILVHYFGDNHYDYIFALKKIIYSLLPMACWVMSGIALFLLSLFLYGLFSFLKGYPLRFNRERREVCLVKRGKAEFFPWDGIHVQITNTGNVTAYNVTHSTEMVIGLLHPDDLGYIEKHIYGNFATAINEWEAIRQFMDFESMPTDNIGENTPYGQLLKYPPGTPQHFDRAREGISQSAFSSYLFWLFCHIFTFWKLPCYLAGLINKLQRANHSKEVTQWSKPIPKDQWVKPGITMVNETAKIKQAYAEGQNFMQYFNIPMK